MKKLKKQLVNLEKFINHNRLEFFFLVLVLAVAAFLRLYRIADYMTFLGDEGRDVLVVKRMIVDHKFTLLGPTASVGGFFLGPIYYYFMAPFLWFFRLDPVGPAIMVALFGIATVFLIYRSGRDFFDARVGLLAAGLYAVSPLVISYSRSSWNPNLMPFFSLLILYLLWLTVVKERNNLLAVIGFLFGVAIQLHYLAIFLMVIFIAYFLIFSSLRWKTSAYFKLLSGFFIGWLPFILFELRHHFPNFQTLYRFIFFGKETGFSFQNSFSIMTDVFFRLFNRLVTNNQPLLTTVVLLVSIFVLAFEWLRFRKNRERFRTIALLVFWLLLGVFLFAFYQDDIYDYYLGFSYPLPFLITSFSLVKLSENKKLGVLISVIITLWLFAVNLAGNPFRFEPNRQLAQTRQVAQIIFDQAKGKPFNFGLITGGNSDHAYRYFLELWGNPPVTIENSQVDPERKTVTDQLFVVCEAKECKPLGNPLWEIAGFGRAEIVNQWPAPGGVSIIKLIRYQENK